VIVVQIDVKDKVSKMLKPLNRYKALVVTACAFGLVIGIFIPFLIGVLIDEISRPLEQLLLIAAFVGCIVVLDFFLDWYQNVIWFRLVLKAVNIVRKAMHNMLLGKSIAFHNKSTVGDLTNKLLNDVGSYAESCVIMMPMLLLNLLRITVVFFLLVIMNVWLALVCGILYLLYFGLYLRLNGRLREWSKRSTETYSAMQESANESLYNIDMVQLNLAQKYFGKRFGIVADAHMQNQSRQQLWKSLAQSSTSTMLNLIPIVAVVLGIVLYHREAITVGQIVAFYALLPQLGEPFRNLADFNMRYQSAKGVESRLASLFITEEEANLAQGESISRIETLTLNKLVFCYDQSKIILNGLTFSLEKGDCLGIVGASGVGKTTLLKILLKRLAAQNISVNKTPLSEISDESYFERVSFLPQDIFLFNDSINENISFGREGNIDAALELAYANDITSEHDMLSGGEKQRIGIARAVFGEKDVIILDEPTSALDAGSEKVIIDNLRSLMEERPVILIIVTHRMGLLDICNKTLTLHQDGHWDMVGS